jgi:hypothetical protein
MSRKRVGSLIPGGRLPGTRAWPGLSGWACAGFAVRRDRRGVIWVIAYGTKFPKAAAKITSDLGQPLAFYDYPAEHWVHLRTTNPIESTFATVRHRSKVTKGPARGPPGWPWRSSSSSQHRTAGAA